MPRVSRFGVRSVTYAIEARDILSKYGIAASVVRLNSKESPRGCGFGIQVAYADTQRAESLLKKAEIDFIRL